MEEIDILDNMSKENNERLYKEHEKNYYEVKKLA